MRTRNITCLGLIGILGGILAVESQAHAGPPRAQPIYQPVYAFAHPSMVNYSSVWTSADRAYHPNLDKQPPTGCEAPPILTGPDSCGNPNWGPNASTCAAFYAPHCAQAKELHGDITKAQQDGRATAQPVFPIDFSGNEVHTGTGLIRDGLYMPYQPIGGTKPGVGMTVFSAHNQRGTFGSNTLPFRVERTAYDPNWLTRTEVNSCSEYVYKRFYGYRRYVDVATVLDEDYDAAFRAAYATPASDPREHLSGGISQWDQMRSYFRPGDTPVTEGWKRRIPVPLMRVELDSIPRNAFFNPPAGVHDRLSDLALNAPNAAVRAKAKAVSAKLGPSDLWRHFNGVAMNEFDAHEKLYEEMQFRYPDLSRAEVDENEKRTQSFAELVQLDGVLHRKLECLVDPDTCGPLDPNKLVAGLVNHMSKEDRLTNPVGPVTELDDWTQYSQLDSFEGNLRTQQVAQRINELEARLPAVNPAAMAPAVPRPAMGLSSSGTSTLVSAKQQQQINLLRAQIDKVEKDMVEALLEEQDRGDQGCVFDAPQTVKVCKTNGYCYNVSRPYKPNRCDWSTKAAVKRFTSMLREYEEKEFNRCQKHTNDDIGWAMSAAAQKRKFYPSYSRGPQYKNITTGQISSMKYAPNTNANGVYPPIDHPPFVYHSDDPKPHKRPPFYWNSDALTMDAFLTQLDESVARRTEEQEALAKHLHTFVDAGAEAMKGVPTFKKAVVDSKGNSVAAAKASNYYATDKVLAVGTAKSDGASYGDPAWFAAGWKYDWSWNVTPRLRTATKASGTNFHATEAVKPWRRIGGLEGSMHAQADAQARGLFDLISLNVLHAQADATVNNDKAESSAQLTILNQNILFTSTSNGSGANFQIVRDASDKTSTKEYSYTIPIWCVTMRFFASASLEGGVRFVVEGVKPTLNFTPARESGGVPAEGAATFAMHGYVEPYAKANAYGGADIDVQLVRLGVPSGISLASTKKSSPDVRGGYDLAYTEGSKVVVNTLSGQVNAYLKVGVGPFSKKFSARLFGWNGATQEIPVIAEKSRFFGLDSWAWQIYGSPLDNPGQREYLLLVLMDDLE